MDYGRLILRSFEITFKHRALWLFGILFALAGGTGGGNGNLNFNLGSRDIEPFRRGMPFPTLPIPDQTFIITIVTVIACIAIAWVVLSIILRIVSRGALIGLVNELETKQVEPRFRHGFNIGTERFVSLLGIALVVNVPLFILSAVLIIVSLLPMLAAILPLISSGARNVPDQAWGVFVGGISGSIALLCCVSLFLLALNLVIRPVYEFAVRECVVSGRGVMDSLLEGYRQVRANLGRVAFLYILVIGLGLGYGILMIPVALLLIAVPSVLAISTYFIANSITPAIIAALVIGIPVLLLLLVIAGFYQAFENNLWTEGYLTLNGKLAPAPPVVSTGPTAVEPAPG